MLLPVGLELLCNAAMVRTGPFALPFWLHVASIGGGLLLMTLELYDVQADTQYPSH